MSDEGLSLRTMIFNDDAQTIWPGSMDPLGIDMERDDMDVIHGTTTSYSTTPSVSWTLKCIT